MLTLSVDNKIAVQKDAIRRQPTWSESHQLYCKYSPYPYAAW
jgi:hypothetical protein